MEREPVQALKSAKVDLDSCARELIHQPGSVQSHGVLLAIDAEGIVRHATVNLSDTLKLTAEAALGRPLGDLIGRAMTRRIERALERADSKGRGGRPEETAFMLRPDRGGHARWLLAHRRGDTTFVEIERVPPEVSQSPRPPPRQELTAIRREANGFGAAQLAAELVGRMTGYARVMVYRFHPDHTGEVTAEVKRAGAVSYLGLRYPASDIPEQARRLYLSAKVRQVVDIRAMPVPIIPAAGAAAERPLDIGLAATRALSPIHMEYLANMGVRASLTLSVIIDGELWGLIACHHDAPRHMPPSQRRNACKVAEALALSIAVARRREATAAASAAARMLRQVEKGLARAVSPLEELVLSRTGLISAVAADGIAFAMGDTVITAGRVPRIDWVRRLGGRLAALAASRGPASSVHGESVTALFPELEGTGSMGSGFAAVPLEGLPEAWIILFADELLSHVNWGGNPDKPADWDSGKGRLTPRKSFELWKQQLRGHSRPWRPQDLMLLEAIAARVSRHYAGRPQLAADEVEEVGRRLGRDRFVRREVLDALLNGIVMVASLRDDGLRIHSMNRLFQDAFGVSPSRWQNLRLADFLERHNLPLELADPDFSDFPILREVTSPRLGRRWISFDRRPIFAVDGARGGAQLSLICLDDVTPYKQAEQALIAARFQAEGALAHQRRFVSSASHELRTPLNAIIGFSEMIQTQTFGPVGDRRYADYARDIVAAGQHLLSLINDILTIGRVQDRGLAMDGDPVDLALECAAAMHLHEEQAALRKVTLRLSPPPAGAVLVQADRRALQQILLNLISNAVKFTEASGRVTVAVGLDALGNAWIDVSDTGIGITEPDLAHLFEPFFRSGNVFTRQTEGTGLGLTIVKALVEAHGGQLTIASRYGAGTRVNVSLPQWRVVEEA